MFENFCGVVEPHIWKVNPQVSDVIRLYTVNEKTTNVDHEKEAVSSS